MVFSVSALWWRRIRGLWKLPDGRAWLRGTLDLVLMGRAMLIKSLIQFSIDGWSCVPPCIYLVLEKTLESPLDCKEIQPVHPKGDQSWLFIGRTDAEAKTPILWQLHVKSWLTGKDPDAGRHCGQEEKGKTEDELAGWHHRLDGHEFE